jgi:hypothetical protein
VLPGLLRDEREGSLRAVMRDEPGEIPVQRGRRFPARHSVEHFARGASPTEVIIRCLLVRIAELRASVGIEDAARSEMVAAEARPAACPRPAEAAAAAGRGSVDEELAAGG